MLCQLVPVAAAGISSIALNAPMQDGEHGAPAVATEQEPQQPERRRGRGFDPRRASVAMSSNFALHTAGAALRASLLGAWWLSWRP